MSVSDLETKTQLANRELESQGIHICWGGDFSVRGNIFHRGIDHLLKGQPVIFPICLNNGYYNEGQLENLARGISQFDSKIYAFLTDGPSKHNYMALGYSEDEALRKTRLEGNGLLNRFRRGLYSIGEETTKRFLHFSWDDIYRHPEWINESKTLHQLYTSNSNFRDDVELTTRQVLSHRKKLLLNLGFDVNPADLAMDDIKKAIDYTLDEISFVTVSCKLLHVDGICYIYKEGWTVLEKLADGMYNNEAISGIGFLEFHVLPQICSPETPVIVTKKELAEMSSRLVAEKPRRSHAPQACIERAPL